MKISPLFKILVAPAAIAVALATMVEATSLPGGIESQRLERYKEGKVLELKFVLRRENYKNKCLVESSSSRISYHFFKSTSTYSLQDIFSGYSKPVNIGSIPKFDVINTDCGNLNIEGRKWNDYEEYKSDIRSSDLVPLQQKLKKLANQDDVSRFSQLIPRIKPI